MPPRRYLEFLFAGDVPNGLARFEVHAVQFTFRPVGVNAVAFDRGRAARAIVGVNAVLEFRGILEGPLRLAGQSIEAFDHFLRAISVEKNDFAIRDNWPAE